MCNAGGSVENSYNLQCSLEECIKSHYSTEIDPPLPLTLRKSFEVCVNIFVPTVGRKTLGTTFISDNRESVMIHSMELYTTIINYIFKE